MNNRLVSADPDVWLVEFTNEQMAAFWNIAIAYEEDTFADPREMESVQQAVSNARPIWEQSPTMKEQ